MIYLVTPYRPKMFPFSRSFVFLNLLMICSIRVNAQCSTNCTTTLNSSGGSGDLTLESGDTLCINATSANLDVDYDEIRMRPGSGMKMCSDPEDTIKFNAELRFFSGGTGTHSLITNNGNFDYTFGNLGYARTNIINHGYWEVQGGFLQNTNGPPSFTNNVDAQVVINGDFDVNNGEFSNAGDLLVTGDMDFNGADFSNTSTVEVEGLLTINSSTTVTVANGIFIADELVLNSGDLEAGAGGCAAFLIKNSTTINGGVNVNSGDIWLTDSTDADTVNSNGCPGPAEDCGGFVFSATNNCFIALPVFFRSVSVSREENGIHVNWSTLIEVNSDYFSIEWSDNLRSWKEAGRVEASGNSRSIVSYQRILNSIPNGLLYLRVASVDRDGNVTISEIMPVFEKNIESSTISLNVENEALWCDWSHNDPSMKIELWSYQGYLLRSKRIEKYDVLPLHDIVDRYVIAKVYGQSGIANVRLFLLENGMNCYHTQLRVR